MWFVCPCWCVLVGVSWLVWLPACLEPRALLVGVLVGSGYLHALNLVSLVRVPCWFVWFVLVRVPCWLVCPWFVSWLVWLPACLEPRVPGSCALLVRVVRAGSCALLVGVSLVRVLVGVVTCMP